MASRWRSPYDREILRLAVPALGALVAEPLYVLVDTAIVGHLGTRQLAGLAVSGIVLTAAFSVFNFLASHLLDVNQIVLAVFMTLCAVLAVSGSTVLGRPRTS